MEFAKLSRRRQCVNLRSAAVEALAAFGHREADLRLINYEFNATYRVDSGSNRYALRLNVNSESDLPAAIAETAWVSALATDTDVQVASPQISADGAFAHEVHVPVLDRKVPAVLYSWLDGPDMLRSPSARRVGTVGRLTAQLHNHAETWTPPVGVRSLDSFLLNSPNNLVALEAPWFDATARAVLLEALRHVEQATARVFSREPRHVIHGDLHLSNLKWVSGRPAVFDFDDSGICRPLVDLAVTAYYLRDDRPAEVALLEGYQALRPLPEHTPDEFEALVAARNLLLFNDVVTNVTAGLDDFLPGYCALTVKRMKHYLNTGEFKLAVDYL